VRYKQTLLGAAWIVLQPVVSMVVFSVLFGGLLKVPSGGVPYPILVGSAHLITKVYFPRLIIPISGVISGLVDFGIAFLVLMGLMVYYGIAPTPAVVLLPAFLLLALVTALGFGLWLCGSRR